MKKQYVEPVISVENFATEEIMLDIYGTASINYWNVYDDDDRVISD